jgi:gamma-glutamyltranspeptidase/glutathione hydrolase
MRKWLFIALLLFGCNAAKDNPPDGLVTKKAMVVSARIEASQIGADIMKKGGNAFDAMVATELALAVAYPYAGNIGGGGFMVYRKANGETGSLDYREQAPAAASKNMFLDASGNVIPGQSTDSALAIGIPGTIAGIFEVHSRFGSLPISELIAPAIALAERGVVVTEKQQKQLDTYREAIIKANGSTTLLGKTFHTGDAIRYPALAETLRRIRKNGGDEFYKGETGRKLVSFIREKGGIISMADLDQYRPVWRKPLTFTYRGLTITTMAPPSSGGFCLAQILGMLEEYDVKNLGHNSEKYIQLLAETERRSYADRDHFLGDPDFVRMPIKQLTGKEYLHKRMAGFSFDRATKSSDVGHGDVQFSESSETTHYSIVDPAGNAVAVTTTLNGAFGSKIYCDELGFFVNNEMDDFSAKPGSANSYGLIGNEANSIAPGKRMLSSMTPTIVEKDGRLLMVLGTPGGSTIITSVLQTILNVAEFGMPMQKAVDAPRFHHQWLPDEVDFEPGYFSAKVLENLRNKGYIVSEKTLPVIGKVDAIQMLKNGSLEAGADRRGDDAAAGF